VAKQRTELQRIHDQYGATLKDFARSMASGGSVQARQALQSEVYGRADGLRQQIATAHRAVEHALKLLAGIQDGSRDLLSFRAESAKSAAMSALAHDAGAIRAAVEALIARREELKPGEPIEPSLPEPTWHPGAGDVSDGDGAQPDVTWNR
jgi:hypothetical protein